MIRLFEKIQSYFRPKMTIPTPPPHYIRVFIIAGNYRHAQVCAEDILKLKRNEWTYVSSVEQLFGICAAKIYTYETWLDNWLERPKEFDVLIDRLNIIKLYPGSELYSVCEDGKIFSRY